MIENSKLFPYDKVTVLNILYDALDAMALRIDKSNSARGTLLVSSDMEPKKEIRIALTPRFTEDKTLVEIYPVGEDELIHEWVSALYDEMKAVIRKAGMDG